MSCVRGQRKERFPRQSSGRRKAIWWDVERNKKRIKLEISAEEREHRQLRECARRRGGVMKQRTTVCGGD